jgi:aldose 1-epimerase
MSLLETLTLLSNGARCDLLPQLGGSMAAWVIDGQDMLRPTRIAAVEARDPFATAGFPLVPYSNRIGQGAFEWAGQRISVARNFPPEPHAIHGVGFERPWQVASRSAESATLSLKHHADGRWPWTFEARQRITLSEDLLSVELEATNLEAQPVPLSFGYHPYFPYHGARLSFHAQGVWLTGEDSLPTEWVKPSGALDFSDGCAVEHADVDHCYGGWNGVAMIMWPDQAHALGITASRELTHAVVCIRAADAVFCFEPVAHSNNALNPYHGASPLPVVAPGERFTASIRFRAIRREVSAPAAHPSHAAPR